MGEEPLDDDGGIDRGNQLHPPGAARERRGGFAQRPALAAGTSRRGSGSAGKDYLAPIVPLLVAALRETRAMLGDANVIAPLLGQRAEAPNDGPGVFPAGAGAGARPGAGAG